MSMETEEASTTSQRQSVDARTEETEPYDSGASRHMSPFRNRLVSHRTVPPHAIKAADGRVFFVLRHRRSET